MSIEKLFASRITGNIHRLGPSIEPGEMGFIIHAAGNLQKMVAIRCDDEDEGGIITEIQEGFSIIDDNNVIVPMGVVEMLTNSGLQTGALYEKTIVLNDGDEGTLFIQHNDSSRVRYN